VNNLNPKIDFWLDVQRELETVHGQSTEQARCGIDGYRQRLAQHEALDAVYHSEPREIAQAILGGRFRQNPPRR
jgi:hypothetical protein